MIEVIVVMILLVIVLALAGRPIIDGIRGVDSVQSRASANAAASDAMERIRTDLELARAPDRDTRHVRDVEKLRRALTEAGFVTRSDDPTEGARTLDVRDIVRATADEVHVRADVLASDRNRPTECIALVASSAASAEYSLVRTVYADERAAAGLGACGGAIVETATLLGPSPRVPDRTPDTTFAYQVLQADCTTRRVASAVGSDLNRILAIDVSVIGTSTRRSGVGATNSSTVIVPTSRDTVEYRRALGCG
jgi:type II secretory pathway pseudopilin PulG